MYNKALNTESKTNFQYYRDQLFILIQEYEKKREHFEKRIYYFEERNDDRMTGYFEGKSELTDDILKNLEKILNE